MQVTTNTNGAAATIAVEGRIDTVTAPQLESEFKGLPEAVTDVVIDFSAVEYISSAGLRVLLSAQKVMNKKGTMKLIGVNDSIMEVFDITGFVDILTIE